MNFISLLFSFLIVLTNCTAQKSRPTTSDHQQATSSQQQVRGESLKEARIIPAAERISVYLPLIKGKRVGIFANQTSIVGNTHLVDTLKKLGVNIKVIFGPEHGFRGTADAGEKVGNYIDDKTGIPVISLYGGKSRPDENDLKDIDILIFDLQDVGCRFYTYINSMQNFLEAALENHKPLLLLDRPNPMDFTLMGPYWIRNLGAASESNPSQLSME